MRKVLALACAIGLLACGTTERSFEIRNFKSLIITSVGSNNINSTDGVQVDSEATVPIEGIITQGSGVFSQGGTLSSQSVVIDGGNTESFILIEQLGNNNHNEDVRGLLREVFERNNTPFGNLTVDQGSVMREFKEVGNE